jgi:SAM-dependent methyltransferase
MESTLPPPSPPTEIIIRILTSAWAAKVLGDVTRLGIPDLLQRFGAMSATDLVTKCGVAANPEALERALRTCAAVGVFTEASDGRFGPSATSSVLTTESPVSVKKLAEVVTAKWYWRAWGGFANALATGEPQIGNELGMKSASLFEYLNAHQDDMAEFGEAMKSNSLNSMRGVLEQCDLSATKKVIDVGGGFGHLIIALLQKYLYLRGVVLDLSQVIQIAMEHPLIPASIASRLDFIAGDMFDSVPRADVYILKHIIHDWDDARCVRVLRNCHDSLEEGGRIICVDSVVPPLGDTGALASKLLDVNMMVMLPGKERTEAQWSVLFEQAGLRVSRVVPLSDNFGTSIVEAVRSR